MEKNKVIIYSTPICPHCHFAKEFLKKHNVNYTEYNVAEDDAKLSEMVQKSGQMGVPVIEINGKILIGFERHGIAKALDIKE